MRHKHLAAQAPAFLWALIILLLTGLPGSYFPEIKSFWDWLSPDKVVHLAMFGIFTFLLFFGNRAYFLKGNQRSLSVLFIGTGIAFGGLTELLQAFVFVGRDGNYYDFFANTAGTFAGTLLFQLLLTKKLKKRNSGLNNY